MSAKIISGVEIAKAIREELKVEVAELCDEFPLYADIIEETENL